MNAYPKVKYKDIYHPQSAAKDALAMFLGHKDWLTYVNSINNKMFFSSKYKLIQNLLKSYK